MRTESISPTALGSASLTASSTAPSHSASRSVHGTSLSATISRPFYAPAILNCSVPYTVYENVTFAVTIRGQYLSAADRFAFVHPSSGCLAALHLSTVLKRVNDSRDVLFPTITLAQSLLTAGVYSVCYRPSIHFNLTCPQYITVAGMAPWMNTSLLLSAAESTGAAPVEFNRQHCKHGLVQGDPLPAGFEAGPMIKWDTMDFSFGNGSLQIEPGEQCMFVVQPYNATPGFDGVEIAYDASLSSSGDALLLFLPVGFGRPVSPQSASPSCPTSIPGFSLVAVGIPGTLGKWRAPLPRAIVVACAGSKGDMGKFAGMSYTTVPSPCPGDCKDSTGALRGTCDRTSMVCTCDYGFTGEDCSLPSICRFGADSTTSTGGKVIVSRSGRFPCGILATADGSNLDRAGPFGVAAKVSKLKLSSNNCSVAYVSFRQDSHAGREALRLCQSDVASVLSKTVSIFMSLTNSTFYVEFRGASEDDSFEVVYSSLALTCPGEPDSSGWVTTKVCHSRGACLPYDFNVSVDLPSSAFRCACEKPYGPSIAWGSCDACGFGFLGPTYPTCDSRPTCPQNCNNRGTCTNSGCVCNALFYGSMCESFIGGQVAAASATLVSRFGMNDGSGGDTEELPVSAAFMSCQVVGCKVDVRNTGNSFYTPSGGQTTFSGHRRSYAATATTNVTSVTNDEGVSLNSVPLSGSIGDYLIQPNISGTPRDVHGRFSVASWVRLTKNSSGFLYAKIDSAFYSDGRSPILERAVYDVQDRTAPVENLLLRNSPFSLYFGIFINGPHERVDIISVDVARRNISTTKEGWFYIRSFFLDESTRGKLFNGDWHFITVSVTEAPSRIQAQIYVDGGTIDANVNFVQCLPFLPSAVAVRDLNASGAATSFDPLVATVFPRGAAVIGYALVGSLDEFRIYSPGIGPLSMVEIAGPQFLSNLALTPPILLAGLVVSAVCGVIGAALLFRRKTSAVTIEEENAAIEEDDDEELTAVLPVLADPEPGDVDMLCEGLPADTPLPPDPTASPNAEAVREQRHENPLVPPSTSPQPSEQVPSDKPQPTLETQSEQEPFREGAALPTSEKDELASSTIVHLNSDAVNAALTKQKKSKTVMALANTTGQMNLTVSTVKATSTVNNGDNASSVISTERLFVQNTSLCQYVWQVLALNMGGFQWPFGFISTAGVGAAAASLCFDVGFSVSFGISFYCTVGLALLAFCIVLGYLILELTKSSETIEAERLDRLRRRRESLLQGNGGLVRRTKKEWIVWTSIVTLSTMYLPATRNSIIGAFCYYTIQCEYYCYHEQAHWNVVYTGSVCLFFVTLCAPIMFARLTHIKRKEFLTHHHGSSEDSDAVKRLETEWVVFLRNDHSPFSGIYDSFEWYFAYFQTIAMIAKAVICFATLATDANSNTQTLVVTIIQGFFALGISVARPFLPVCNAIVCVGQLFIVLTLAVNCYFRLDAENRDVLFGYILLGLSVGCLVFQLTAVVFYFSCSAAQDDPVHTAVSPTRRSSSGNFQTRADSGGRRLELDGTEVEVLEDTAVDVDGGQSHDGSSKVD